ncbi:MAG: DUF167 domain-containing protein [Legionellaceae bacterium]|nr:DUF167 domain-containing protein [Legionellaceae bacterium]
MNEWYTQTNHTTVINVYVQPGAKHTEIMGFHGNSLKIRLASPPIDGRANQALLKYVAILFKVPLRQVQLHRGDKSRHKVITITNSSINPADIFTEKRKTLPPLY